MLMLAHYATIAGICELVHVNVKDTPADEVRHMKDDKPLREKHQHVSSANSVVQLVLEFDLGQNLLLRGLAVDSVAAALAYCLVFSHVRRRV